QHLLDAVALARERPCDAPAEGARVRAQERRGTHGAAPRGLQREGTLQQLIGEATADETVTGELAAIVLREGAGGVFEGADAQAVAPRRTVAAHVRDELIDRLQLVECRPVRVVLAPAGLRCEPHCEGLSEILGRMRLGIPLAEMMHVAAATGTRAVASRVRARGRPEHLAPAPPPSQPGCV